MILNCRAPEYDRTKRYQVWCDGVPLVKCFYADTEEGFAKCVALNEQGQAYADRNRPEGHAVAEHRGAVGITCDGVLIAGAITQ